MNTKHEFALYVHDLQQLLAGNPSQIAVQDQALVTRVGSVLRLAPGEHITLFDQTVNAECQLVGVAKKAVNLRIITQQLNKKLKPEITFILPLLKRDDFESALYSLVELGVNNIQLVSTQKTQRTWAGDKEYERCQRIMIAAAEQSKNFALPTLLKPVSLAEYIQAHSNSFVAKVHFEVDGQAMLQVANQLHTQKPQSIALIVGPEGDFVAEEKALLAAHGFVGCRLTPTVLRSVQAVALGVGIVRSVLVEN